MTENPNTPRTGMNLMTIIWGALILVAGIGVLAWSAGYRFDLALTGSIVLGLAGLGLVTNAVIAAIRSK